MELHAELSWWMRDVDGVFTIRYIILFLSPYSCNFHTVFLSFRSHCLHSNSEQINSFILPVLYVQLTPCILHLKIVSFHTAQCTASFSYPIIRFYVQTYIFSCLPFCLTFGIEFQWKILVQEKKECSNYVTQTHFHFYLLLNVSI